MFNFQREPFSGHPEIQLYTVDFEGGISVRLTNYGATLVSIEVPDTKGKKDNVVLGYNKLDGYLGDHPFFGSTCGRYANRIKEGKLTIDEVTYQLSTNNDPNHLHGGDGGFHRKIWKEHEVSQNDESVTVSLRYESAHLEENYPGNLQVIVSFTVTTDAVEISYEALTDQSTVINLTNHSYFNLAGDSTTSVFGSHSLQLSADHYLPLDETQIPTGEQRPVEETAFDYRQLRLLTHPKGIEGWVGYDHCYVLNVLPYDTQVATLRHERTGRSMEVYTTEPGVQLYTANFLEGTPSGKGYNYDNHTALCLETQHFPDSPNQPDFPSTLLKKGETFTSKTKYAFRWE